MGPTRRAAIVGGLRTPFARAGAQLARRSPLELLIHAAGGLLARLSLPPQAVETLVAGCVVADPRIPHLAREVVLRGGFAPSTRALTITDNCVSGITAIALVAAEIEAGRAEVGLAAGAESLSRPPLLFGDRARDAFLGAARAKSPLERARSMLRLRPLDFRPVSPGIVEPSTGLSMGEHCELMVKEWRIPRELQDAIALQSHERARAATEDGHLKAEILPLDGLDRDGTVRADTSAEKLARLPPVFDPSAAGTITAGSSSPLTDGAAAILLMEEQRARREGREVLALVLDHERGGFAPAEGLLMGPALTVPRLLRRHGLGWPQLDLIDLHEAFAGQVACNLEAWATGWKEPALGRLELGRLNLLGGSIALGHPFAATGIRMATTAAGELARRGGQRALLSVCGAGATAAAMLLERA